MGCKKEESNAYEEARKQRLEENLKRMQDLNLPGLVRDLSATATKSQQKPSKPRTPKIERGEVSVRRSARVACLPPADYREVTVDIPIIRRSSSKRNWSARVASSHERQYTIEKAAALEEELGTSQSLFIKPMLPSHVSGGFWLGLPSDFCNKCMPKKDEWFILEDENGEETNSLYLFPKCGLSAGWRGFSIAHELMDGDCLIFQMTEPRRFKVYIIRVDPDVVKEEESGGEEVDDSKQILDDEGTDNGELQDADDVNKKKRKYHTQKNSKRSQKSDAGSIGVKKSVTEKKEKKSNSTSGKSTEENLDATVAEAKNEMSGTPNGKTQQNAKSNDNRRLTHILPTKKKVQSQSKSKSSKVPFENGLEASKVPPVLVDA